MDSSILIVLAALAVTAAAFGQVSFLGGLPVLDATNFANAIKRHRDMIKQYEQLVLTYGQLILEYEHFPWMAKQFPRPAAPRAELHAAALLQLDRRGEPARHRGARCRFR